MWHVARGDVWHVARVDRVVFGRVVFGMFGMMTMTVNTTYVPPVIHELVIFSSFRFSGELLPCLSNCWVSKKFSLRCARRILVCERACRSFKFYSSLLASTTGLLDCSSALRPLFVSNLITPWWSFTLRTELQMAFCTNVQSRTQTRTSLLDW